MPTDKEFKQLRALAVKNAQEIKRLSEEIKQNQETLKWIMTQINKKYSLKH